VFVLTEGQRIELQAINRRRLARLHERQAAAAQAPANAWAWQRKREHQRTPGERIAPSHSRSASVTLAHSSGRAGARVAQGVRVLGVRTRVAAVRRRQSQRHTKELLGLMQYRRCPNTPRGVGGCE
jgi:hypothetical protein